MVALKTIIRASNGGEIMCKICLSNPCLSRCPNSPKPKIIGHCKYCCVFLREDYEYFTDKDNNSFCSEECALKYHDVKPTEWTY